MGEFSGVAYGLGSLYLLCAQANAAVKDAVCPYLLRKLKVAFAEVFSLFHQFWPKHVRHPVLQVIVDYSSCDLSYLCISTLEPVSVVSAPFFFQWIL